MTFLRRALRACTSPRMGWVAALIAACWIASAQLSSKESHNAYASRATVTLAVILPPRMDLHIRAAYQNSTTQAGCPATHPQLQFDSTHSDSGNDLRFSVPLRYYLEGCELLLESLAFDVEAFPDNGSQAGVIATAGTIAVRDFRGPGVPSLPETGEKYYRGLCTWATGNLRLDCRAMDSDWLAGPGPLRRPGGAVGRDDLPGKTLHLELRTSPRNQELSLSELDVSEHH